MNYKIGNEIDHLGIAQAEADYRKDRIAETVRSWARTLVEAILLIAMYIIIMLFAFILCGKVGA